MTKHHNYKKRKIQNASYEFEKSKLNKFFEEFASDASDRKEDDDFEINDEMPSEANETLKTTKYLTILIIVVTFAVFSLYVFLLYHPPFTDEPDIEQIKTEIYCDGSEETSDKISIKHADEGKVILQKLESDGSWADIDSFKLKNGTATIKYPAHSEIYSKWRIKTPKFQSYLKVYDKSTVNINMVSYNTQNVELNSGFACIIDQHGKIIYNKNADSQQEIGSITKLMTYLVSIDKSMPSDRTIVSQEAADTEYPSLDGAAYEILSVKNLYAAMLLESSNDAAVAIAEEAAGSHALFVELMNNKAHEIGINDTLFKNANGLDEEGQVSSAHSACIMMKECYDSDLFRKIEREQPSYIESETGKYWNIESTTYPFNQTKGVRAAKTGTTKKAGYCLSFVYEKDNTYYYVTTLNADTDENRWNDAYTLIDYINQGI